jgi:hypothetical protein
MDENELSVEEIRDLLRDKGFGARLEAGTVIVYLKNRRVSEFEVFLATDLPEDWIVRTFKALVVLQTIKQWWGSHRQNKHLYRRGSILNYGSCSTFVLF